MKSPNALSALIDIYISPSKAFNGIEQAKGWENDGWPLFV